MSTDAPTALLVIDLQHGLFRKSTPIFRAGPLLDTIDALIERARAAGALVVMVQHASDKVLPYGSPDWQLHPRLHPADVDLIVHKQHGNAFEDTPLHAELAGREIGRLASQADRVVREILPRIEQDTGYSFRDPDGLVRILLHPSTARLFLTIRAGFPDAALPIPADDLTLLAAFPDGAHAAAIVGDVTLQVKVLSGEQAPAAEFAALADRWGLSACRTGSPAGGGPAQEKETLARAVLGLLYVDGGTGALRAVAPLLVPARKL